MRTRKTFIHEDGIYEGVFHLPEPCENHPKEVVSINDSYDWYPEKQPTKKTEIGNFEVTTEFSLGGEYKFQSKIDNFMHFDNMDADAFRAP